MDEWPLWAAGYLGIGLFAGALRLILLKITSWSEAWVNGISRFGPAAFILVGIVVMTAFTPPYDSLKWGLLSLILPKFIAPVLVLCYLIVSVSAFLWPAATIRAKS